LPAINFNLNLNVGLVRLYNDFPVNFGPLFQEQAQPKKLCADTYRLWAKHFAPTGNPEFVVKVPESWVPFFLTRLMDPSSFDWAKSFLGSNSWRVMVGCAPLEDNLQFALPNSCPDSGPIICEEDDLPISEAVNSSHPSSEVEVNPMVETAFRRSPRIKNRNGGFRQTTCSSKNCLACSSHPPGLSIKVIKDLGASVCKIPEEKLCDSALKGKAKNFKTIGKKKTSGKSTKPKKIKKASHQSKKNDADEEDDEEDLRS
jgi:hypothetical protein